MKHFFVIPFMLLYLLAVSGVTVRAHYCGKHLASWSVYVQPPGCGAEGCGNKESKPHKCCKDKVTIAKVQDDHSQSAFSFSLPAVAVVPTPVYTETAPAAVSCYAVAVAPSHRPNAPPGRWQTIPLYRLFSSVTYYG